jgi:hypothetical protein
MVELESKTVLLRSNRGKITPIKTKALIEGVLGDINPCKKINICEMVYEGRVQFRTHSKSSGSVVSPTDFFWKSYSKNGVYTRLYQVNVYGKHNLG